MAKHNAANERIKRQYFQYLREAQRKSEVSVDAAAKALSRFEEATGRRDFKRFHREQAVAFKRKLNDQLSARTGEKLSRATVHSTLRQLRAFFIWLADQPGYKSKLNYSDADYFNLPDGDVRIAMAHRERPVATLEQLHHILTAMPAQTNVERRDRALVAFTLLTGCRDGALVSLKLKHVSLEQGRVEMDAREVKTKFSKSFIIWFFPVGGEALEIVKDWVSHLRTERLWGEADPLFPATLRKLGPSGHFEAAGLERRHWQTSEAVRRVFKTACQAAGLPYFNPHSIRNTLARLGEAVCRTPEEFKAWSQNLGHEDVMTTFTSYGGVPAHRQAELMQALGTPTDMVDEEEMRQVAETLLRFTRRKAV